MKWSKETMYNFDAPALLLKVPGQPLRECFIAGVAVEVYGVFGFNALFWLPSHSQLTLSTVLLRKYYVTHHSLHWVVLRVSKTTATYVNQDRKENYD